MLSDASQAASAFTPRLTSLLCTSARFTALITESLSSSGGNRSAPGSWCRMARSTEASTTILLITSGLASLGDQFIDQRNIRADVFPHQPLSALYVAA